MRKTSIVIGALGVCLAATVWGFVAHWMKHSYKENEGRVSSFVMEAQGAFKAPELELCKLIGDPYEVAIDKWQVLEYEKRINSLPMIESASVKKNRSVLYFYYTLKTPLFELADYENLGVDRAGTTFPLFPFYHASYHRPKLVMGLNSSDLELGTSLDQTFFNKALSIYDQLVEQLPSSLILKKLDVKDSQAMSLGKRKVIAQFDFEGVDVYVLFFPDLMEKVAQKIVAVLSSAPPEKGQCISIDLRVDDRAYVIRQ